MKNKLNIILLYSFINLPLQHCYFSKNINIKTHFLDIIYEKMKLSPQYQIFNSINIEMDISNNDSLYIALGANQAELFRRITSKAPEIPYINICNTGIRTQYLQSEMKIYLIDNIYNYYTKPEYKNLIIQCSVKVMTDDIYNSFIKDILNLDNNITEENVLQIFNKYNFSVETANAFVEYLKLGVSLDDIIIVRLGEKIKNENLIYNKDKVYILFNSVDVTEAVYNGIKDKYIIKRATTEENAKALFYLMNEYKNFLNKEKYDNIILISNQRSAERQLEAMNIISYTLNNDIKFNYAIWNKKYEKALSEKNISDDLTETMVKSYNIIVKSLQQYYLNEYEKNKKEEIFNINKFIQEMISFTDMLK